MSLLQKSPIKETIFNLNLHFQSRGCRFYETPMKRARETRTKNSRSLLQKSPIKETIFCERDLKRHPQDLWVHTANSTWGDIFESSKLKAPTCLLAHFSEKRRSSFELWALKQHSKMSPQVGSAVHATHSATHCNTLQHTATHPTWDRLYQRHPQDRLIVDLVL